MINIAPSLEIDGDLILAPMDGYSDSPMRRLCRRFGSAASYTEFISTHEFLHRAPFIHQKTIFFPEERPIIFQLLGEEAGTLLQVAKQLLPFQPNAFDLNLGCPQRGIVARGAGAGLLRSPNRVAQIIQHLVQNLPVPITAKLRLGWDDENRTALLIARIIEENGGSLIAIHGRTKSQAYRGVADLDAIAEVAHAVRIPVIANGVIPTNCPNISSTVEEIKQYTACAAIMIGRAAIGNPWIFAKRDLKEIPLPEVKEVILLHLKWMLDFYGSPQGLIFFRKHLKRYLAPYNLPRSLFLALLTLETPNDFPHLLDQCLDHLI